ncbi:hypothetical protein ACOMHN_042406 [Nucella lapillus]
MIQIQIQMSPKPTFYFLPAPRSLAMSRHALRDPDPDVPKAYLLLSACSSKSRNVTSRALERVQRQAARFITKDYRTREPGSVSRMLQDLNLPPLADRRKQARLGLMYKITGDFIPAIPPKNYLTPVSAGRRQSRPTKHEGFEVHNIVERRAVMNTRGFKLPFCKTEQYQHSFFVQTVMDWNHLEEDIVKAGSVSAFTSALGRSTSPAP